VLCTEFLLLEAKIPTSRKEREKWGTLTWTTRPFTIGSL